MASRIYSLAKELKLDSKVLVDLCPKAGVLGKGSALASLTDEEVVKIKAFLAGGATASAAPKPVVQAAPVQTKTAVGGSASGGGLSGSGGVAVASPPEPLRREDYVAPAGVSMMSKPPVIGSKSEKPAGDAPKKPSDGPKPAKGGPVIRMAALPTSSGATPPPKAAEPEPQKPDIKLPIDAIRASKAGGSTPLRDHMRKHEAKRKADQAAAPVTPQPAGKGKGPGAPRGPAAPLLPLGEGKDRKRGGKAPGGGEFDSALGGREQRQLSRKRLGDTPGKRISLGDDDRAERIRRNRPKHKHTGATAPRKGKVVVQMPCTVRSLSEALGYRAPQVLGKLLALGTMANINTELSSEIVELLAVEFGVEIDLRQVASLEEQLQQTVAMGNDPPESLQPRAPVVTFLGHVDHGKTSLLDRIIGIDVVSGESGGITQHIRAYRIEKDGRAIAFVDTPGHEAFTEMRARGANVTDIAVLVVAADDGVMPQTEEAISHAKAAGVPIVVALNKIDLPGVDQTRIMQQLAANELLPTEWGGDTEVVPCSATKGTGVDTLLETLLTIAELHDYKSNPSRAAYGTCLEAELHEGRGVIAKMLVQNGTLKVGDVVVCGSAYGRVKAIYNTLKTRETMSEAGPATPVNITGFDTTPGAGDHFYVLDDITRAREIAEQRLSESRERSLGGGPTHVTLETLHERLGQDEVQTLNLILRADVRGSIEAIQKELGKLAHPEVQVKVLQATVGGISEADVYLADASDAIIVGFNVVPDEKARSLAQSRGVQVRRYEIIYNLTDDLKAALEGLLKPEKREVELGRALVQRTFVISRVGTVAGCRVLSGTVERSSRVRIIRDNRIVGDYGLDSLKREKDDAREVREGYECGIKLAGFNDLKEGDVLEAYRVEEVARTL